MDANTDTPTTARVLTERHRDKYGRSCTQFDRLHVSADGRWVARDRNVAVLVCLPRHYAETYGDRYLVNVRPTPEQRAAGQYTGTVTYHRTRAQAVAVATTAVARY